MSKVYWMVTITGRDQGERFSSMHKSEKIPVILVALGKGTASSEVLDCLGLEESDKIVLFTAVTGDVWKHVKKGEYRCSGYGYIIYCTGEQHGRAEVTPVSAGGTGI